MTSHHKNARHSGFSLLEVLVAIVILSIGLLALASLQLSLMRSSAESKTQTVAAALAKEKVESLRAFELLTDYQALGTTSPETENLNDSGGNYGGVNFVRTTTVARYVYNKQTGVFDNLANTLSDAAITGLKDATHDYSLGKDFKRVQVNVSWTDAAGTSARVAMEDVIDSNIPSEVANIVKSAAGTVGPRKIKVKIYDPATDAMVIPIALGNGVNSAATNPKPNVVRNNFVVETTFDVLTYSGLNEDEGTATAQAKVETAMVGCTCDIDEKPASTVRGYRPSYWNGYRYTVPNEVDDYSPPAAADTQSADSNSDKCTVCCRDHHDPAGVTGATFSPLRLTKVNGIVTVPHRHYLNKSKLATEFAETGTYKEACRMVRSDGVWSVATDLSNDYFGLLATGDGTNADTYVPDSTTSRGSPAIEGGAVGRYQQFVLEYMRQRYVPTPTAGTEQATYNTVGDPATLAGSAAYELDYPESVAIDLAFSGKWLHSRGLYVDYLEQEAVDAITNARSDVACNTATTSPAKSAEDVLKECILKLLPFTSINLTELADWAPLSGELSVTNAAYYQTSTDPEPVRGKVTSAASVAKNLSGTSKSRLSNSGLLDLSFDSISAVDDVVATDSQEFAIGGGTAPTSEGNGTFRVTITAPSGYVGTFGVNSLVPGKTSENCNLDTSTAAEPYDYLCQVTKGSATAGLGVVGSPGMSVIVSQYNASKPGSLTSPSLTCSYGGTSSGTWANVSSGTTSYAVNFCYDFDVQDLPLAKNATRNENALSPYGVANSTLSAETTTIGFGQVDADNNITIGFKTNSGPTSTQSPASCTYTCQQEQGGACKVNKATYFSFAIAPVCP
jgi:type IV pilus modification protein PilV